MELNSVQWTVINFSYVACSFHGAMIDRYIVSGSEKANHSTIGSFPGWSRDRLVGEKSALSDHSAPSG
jgi:hypothetical protein